jgi:hypothetical protein
MSAFAYTFLQACIIRFQGPESKLAKAVGKDTKGKLSLALYATGILSALLGHPWFGGGLYALVALLWFVPDPRIESQLNH